MKKIFVSLIVAMYFISTACPQDKEVKGSWIGKLEVGTVSLRIIFHISGDSPDYKVTMDSPDQGANGIKIGPVKVDNDSVIIGAASLMGEYRGEFNTASTIKGKWTQAGRVMPLDLEKLKVEFELKRPQEPKAPYPYIVKDIIFHNVNADIDLAGTLTIPSDGQKLPAVILVSGSGPQNRDEELFGHKPFKVIADYLTRNGIAVLRYDDRGVAKSGGTLAASTSDDLATDALAAIKYLQSVDKIDRSKVGIIGHSEGGLIAQIVVAEYDEVAFIVSLAGQGTTGRQILLDQSYYINRISNVSEESNMLNLKLNNAIYDIVELNEDPVKGFELIISKADEVLNTPGKPQTSIDDLRTTLSGNLGPASYPWIRYFLKSDPAKLLPNIKCPFLALNGEKDCQVLFKQNLEGIKKGLSANKDVTTKSFPDLNHLFQHSTTGLVNEYGQIEETMSPEVLEVIVNWIKERF